MTVSFEAQILRPTVLQRFNAFEKLVGAKVLKIGVFFTMTSSFEPNLFP